MAAYEVFIALLIAIVFAAMLMAIFARRPREPRSAEDADVEEVGAAEGLLSAMGPLFFFLFVVIFLAALAGGLWIRPVGPVFWGVAWVPLVLAGLFVALLLAAVAPVHDPSRQKERPTKSETRAAFAFGLFFWILIAFLLVAIGIGYWR